MKARALIKGIQNVLVLLLSRSAVICLWPGRVGTLRRTHYRFAGRRGAPRNHKGDEFGHEHRADRDHRRVRRFRYHARIGGSCSLTVTATGFETINATNIEVQVGQIVRQDLVLKVGEATTTVEVYANLPLLSTDSATLGTVMTNQQLTDLPLNGRGFYRLAELTPGAALLPATGNSLAIRPEIVNGNTISGIRGSAISFLLDGVDVSEQHQGGTFIQTSIDALQEFSVQQSPYSAEYNRGGAFFNATTKSGTNKFHGECCLSFFETIYLTPETTSTTRAILKRNQFGGDIGGPFILPHLYNGRDKTFFFVDYEGQRLRQLGGLLRVAQCLPMRNVRAILARRD